MPPHDRAVTTDEFARDCLRLVDEVHRTGAPLVITRDAVPIARLVPAGVDGPTPFVGRSMGVIYSSPEDLIAPVGEDWEADSDL